MQLRTGDASDGFVAVRIGRELIRRPALNKLACVRAMIEKCDHPQFNSTRVATFLALAQMQSEPFPNKSPVPFETGPSLDGSGFATRFLLRARMLRLIRIT